MRTLLFALCFLAAFHARGQMLHPKELIMIHHSAVGGENSLLLDQGFRCEHYSIRDSAVSWGGSWYFQVHAGKPAESVDASIVKSVNSSSAETWYTLYNVFMYKKFVDQLLLDGFGSGGVCIYKEQAYTVYKKGNVRFLVRERWSKAANGACFDIVMSNIGDRAEIW